VATPTITPVITISCSAVAGMVKSDGAGGLVTDVAGVDYVSPASMAIPPAIGATTPNTGNFTTFQTAVYAVGSLPPGTIGMRAMVNNALTPVFGSAVVAGGTVVTPVFYNGSASIVG